ncbi:MAG: putative Histidine kinase [Candidatus Saccharibacteria bacterium]|nr:putative Histidine kinase [Candidatus Saccharibacteria bacterium]
MAVEQSNKQPAMIRDYWPRFRRHAMALTILMQIAGTVAIGSALLATDAAEPTPPFWVTIIAVLAGSIGVNILLVNLLSTPLKDLTSALTHISGEPSLVTPPNPNARHFERDGFKPLLQLVYQLAATKESAEDIALTPVVPSNNLSTALENTSAGFMILTAKQQVLYANPKAPVHTNPKGEVVIDLIFDEEPTLEDWLKDCEEHAVHAEHTWQRVANKITGEEDRKIYDLTASYQKGSEAEVVLMLFERTDEYQPEDDDLDFIAFAAHELRGPITVIRGYLDVLGDELEQTLDVDQTELLKRLVVSANRLSSYVNNILNASRYDRRHLKVHLREDSIADIYDTISDDMRLRAVSQNRMLTVAFPEDLPTVAADRGSISEVLSNLIDNAIKYSNEGGVVSVTATHEGENVKVSVEDHGIGMPGSVVSNLFHKFYRSHRSRETVAGTGIGLYISKAIVESHGGKIGVRSAEGEGSTFEFNLPVYSAVAEKLSADHNSNESLIEHNEDGWIKNHAMYRG